MGNVGSKVSRQGYSVDRAADTQLLFSSAFKSAVVLFSGKVTIADLTVPQNIVTHNLGFYPAHYTYIDFGDGILKMMCQQDGIGDDGEGAVFTNTTSLFFQPSAGMPMTGSATIHYFIFNIDLETNYTAPIINTTEEASAGLSGSYGFKASRDGLNVLTAALSDLQVYSGASLASQDVRNQIVHSVTTGTIGAAPDFESIAHSLGYAPMYMVYVKNPTYGYHIVTNSIDFDLDLILLIIFSFPVYESSSSVTEVFFANDAASWAGSRAFSCVIFKDPVTT